MRRPEALSDKPALDELDTVNKKQFAAATLDLISTGFVQAVQEESTVWVALAKREARLTRLSYGSQAYTSAQPVRRVSEQRDIPLRVA